MRVSTAEGALPMFPKTDGQDRNPENVPNVECPDRHCPACLPARKAVVVAKRDSLGPEVVGTMNDEHVVSHACNLGAGASR